MKKINNNKGFTHKVGTLSLSVRVYVTTCIVYNIQYSLLYYTYIQLYCQCSSRRSLYIASAFAWLGPKNVWIFLKRLFFFWFKEVIWFLGDKSPRVDVKKHEIHGSRYVQQTGKIKDIQAKFVSRPQPLTSLTRCPTVSEWD